MSPTACLGFALPPWRWFGRILLPSFLGFFLLHIVPFTSAFSENWSFHVVAGIFSPLHYTQQLRLEFNSRAETQPSIAQRAHLPPATRGARKSCASLNVRFGNTTHKAEFAAPRCEPALLVVTARLPVPVPGAVDSCVADRDKLAAAAVAETAALEFSASGLYLAFRRSLPKLHESPDLVARERLARTVFVFTDNLTRNGPETQLKQLVGWQRSDEPLGRVASCGRFFLHWP